MITPDSHELPEYIGKYRVRARLGSGGMADVYLGYLDGPAGFVKPVAIKRMKPALCKVDEFVELFLTEARTASLLAHPNICQVNELGASDQDGYFMVLEYLVGVPLTQLLAKQMIDASTFPLGMIVGLISQACEGMHYAHVLCDSNDTCYDIVHRDLSPPNVYMTVNGMAKILDFGISKSTQSVVQTATGQIRGKFTYMSPEQLRGKELDPRSDVFSLAIIAFELLTGRRLFKRPSRLETFEAVVKSPIPRADALNERIPKQVADVVEIGLAQNRNDRFATARAFGVALSAATQKYEPTWPSPQIAEFGERVFRDEIQAHRRWLDAAKSGALSVAEIQDAYHSADLTIVEEEFSATEAETQILGRNRLAPETE